MWKNFSSSNWFTIRQFCCFKIICRDTKMIYRSDTKLKMRDYHRHLEDHLKNFNIQTKGCLAHSKRMNFRKSSKRPLTPPLIFGKSYCNCITESLERTSGHSFTSLTQFQWGQYGPKIEMSQFRKREAYWAIWPPIPIHCIEAHRWMAKAAEALSSITVLLLPIFSHLGHSWTKEIV